MKNIKILGLLLLVGACGSGGGSTNSTDLTTGASSGTILNQGGVQFDGNYTICQGGVINVKRGQFMTYSQVATHFKNFDQMADQIAHIVEPGGYEGQYLSGLQLGVLAYDYQSQRGTNGSQYRSTRGSTYNSRYNR